MHPGDPGLRRGAARAGRRRGRVALERGRYERSTRACATGRRATRPRPSGPGGQRARARDPRRGRAPLRRKPPRRDRPLGLPSSAEVASGPAHPLGCCCSRQRRSCSAVVHRLVQAALVAVLRWASRHRAPQGLPIWSPIASGTSGRITGIEYQSDARFWFVTAERRDLHPPAAGRSRGLRAELDPAHGHHLPAGRRADRFRGRRRGPGPALDRRRRDVARREHPRDADPRIAERHDVRRLHGDRPARERQLGALRRQRRASTSWARARSSRPPSR